MEIAAFKVKSHNLPVLTFGQSDIATNFGAIAREVILVDYYAIIFICCDCYLFF
jgi:hypothetical protein